eukprot:scaffold94503_cov18-Tisochrysis_lutea.AAC.1
MTNASQGRINTCVHTPHKVTQSFSRVRLEAARQAHRSKPSKSAYLEAAQQARLLAHLGQARAQPSSAAAASAVAAAAWGTAVACLGYAALPPHASSCAAAY